MDKTLQVLIILLTICRLGLASPFWYNLSTVGVFPINDYDYKIYSEGQSQLLVIKLLPNLSNVSDCSIDDLNQYKALVKTVLLPIKESIKIMDDAVQTKTGSERIFGVVLAGAALAVATSAQITAGFALHQAKVNEQNIEKIKESLSTTNKAVEKIRLANQQTVLAVQGIQDYINTVLAPQIQELGCEVVGLKTGLALLQYYTNILTVFGPSLRDPVGSKLSIQAISHVAGGNLQSLIDNLGYKQSDLVDLIESGSITGQIIGVDVDDLFIIMNIKFPVITPLDGFRVYETSTISYNLGPDEWYTLVPQYVLVRGYIMSHISTSGCVITKKSIICSQDQAFPMSFEMQQCLRGDVTKCSRSRVAGSLTSRFILLDGNVYANCIAVICRCLSTGQKISNLGPELIKYLHADDCQEISVDGIRIMLGKRKYPTLEYSKSFELGPSVVLNPLDIGLQLGRAQQELTESKELLDKSNEILETVSSVSPLWKGWTGTTVLLAAVIVVILFLGLKMCRKRYMRYRYGAYSNSPRNSFAPSLVGSSSSYVHTIS